MAEHLGTFRVPPQAIEVEKHILGAIFLDSDAMDSVGKVLADSDFYLERNAVVYRAAQTISTAKKTVDLITLSEELRRTGQFDRAGGDGYLMEISSEVVSSANVIQHAQIVKDKSLLRTIISTATQILEGAYSGEVEPQELIQVAGEGLYRIEEAARGATEGLIDMRTLTMRAAEYFDRIAAGEKMRTRFGIAAIDDVIKGFRKSSSNIIAARPGIGKSALLLQGAVQCGDPVPIFSMEMLAQEEIERMMAHLDPTLNSNGVAEQAQVLAKQHLIREMLIKLSAYPIEICDKAAPTIPYMRSEVRRMKRKYGKLGFILTDYLQMVKAVGKHDRRDLAIGSVSEGLKEMSDDVGCPSIAAASLSRECEKRDNKRPVESDLRDAGQIESDAHCIIFLYSEAKYNLKAKKDPKVKSIIEVSMPKNRGGDTGRTLLDFRGAQSWFHPVSHEDQKYYHDFLRGKFLEEGEDPKKLERGSAAKTSKKFKGGTPSSDWGSQGAMPV